MDPFISYDGNTVYYSLIENDPEDKYNKGGITPSWLYKIHLDSADKTPIRLTYDDGFDSHLYGRNKEAGYDQGDVRATRDLSPVPLADGRILFTSNRAAFSNFHPRTADAHRRASVLHLYVMDDHEGELTSASEMNLHLLELGNLSLVQHPMQLMDGRILFSSWQDVATKMNYAMTSLFVVNPDGTGLEQFTEPHDQQKNLEHFITQLPNGDVVAAKYYPSFDYGYGVLNKWPVEIEGPDFSREPIDSSEILREALELSEAEFETIYPHYDDSTREFERFGLVNMTPHTTPKDVPAPNRSGKYSMPSAAGNGDMLLAYSKGYVNWFDAVCKGDVTEGGKCERLRSGIYVFEDAETNLIEAPSELKLVIDHEDYNEIWPRAVLPYQDIYGMDKPKIISPIAVTGPQDSRLTQHEAAGLVGASSTYNFEDLDHDQAKYDPFDAGSTRETSSGNWLIQGGIAGVFDLNDIYGIRLVGTTPKPYTEKTSWHQTNNPELERFLFSSSKTHSVGQWTSLHGEHWEILGEFPLPYKSTGVIDLFGDPDTSWLAKIPSDTPFLIQAVDKDGMTLISELTWRTVKPGEAAVNCGGCHAHSVPTLDFSATQAGRGIEIPEFNLDNQTTNTDIVSDMTQNALWDLTLNASTILADPSSDHDVEIVQKDGFAMFGVEYYRDVEPIIESHCLACHSDPAVTVNGGGDQPYFDGSGVNDALGQLAFNADGSSWRYPQQSKYIRVPQARQSMLTWIAWDERLDGRTDGTRDDDVDFGDIDNGNGHPVLNLPYDEKRIIARWIDLGSPINFPEEYLDGMSYTDDATLPVINVFRPARGINPGTTAKIGFYDAHSGLDTDSALYRIYPASSTNIDAYAFQHLQLNENAEVEFDFNADVTEGADYILEVRIFDNAGNMNHQFNRFRLGSMSPPKPPLLLIN